MTTARLLRSRVSWKLSRTVLKPSRGGDAPAQAASLNNWKISRFLGFISFGMGLTEVFRRI
jgi:hypothetical protein